MNKDLIQTRFSRTLSSYEENARIQKQMAERLMSFISRKEYENILEIGCGTGFLTKLAVENLDFKTYTAIDIVEECETFISPISDKIRFISADIETFLKENNQKYDLIISNAALQWVNDFEGVVKDLSQRGEVVFSTFGKENFREIYHLLGTTLNYYSPEEQEEMFNARAEQEIRIMAFKTPKDVLKHLQLTGVNAIENKAWTKKDLIKFENGYKNLCSSVPTLTYNPVYVHISK